MSKRNSKLRGYEEQIKLMTEKPKEYRALHGLSIAEYNEMLKELEARIKRSKVATRNNRVGGEYERRVARIFKDAWGIKLTRTPKSGGFAKDSANKTIKGDLSCLDGEFSLHIECKNHKSPNILEFLAQAEGDCPSDKIPTVIFYRQQKIKDGRIVQKPGDYITLPLSAFLELVCLESVYIEEE